jgi:hypothetical protein
VHPNGMMCCCIQGRSAAGVAESIVAEGLNEKLIALRTVFGVEMLSQEEPILTYFWHLHDCPVESSDLPLEREEGDAEEDGSGVVFEESSRMYALKGEEQESDDDELS